MPEPHKETCDSCGNEKPGLFQFCPDCKEKICEECWDQKSGKCWLCGANTDDRDLPPTPDDDPQDPPMEGPRHEP